MHKSDILILGGGQLLGRDLVEKLVESNEYAITIANRGITNPGLFPSIDHIKLDRNLESSCVKLQSKIYEYVVDFSCYNLDQFKNVFTHCKYKNKYVYISTMSVFDEDTISKADTSNNYYWYCVNKLEIEKYILDSLKNKELIIVRPCAIYGENDYTNRFYKKNNLYYHTSNHTLVNNSDGYMYVRDFTNKLIDTIFNMSNGIKTINIK